MADLGLALYKAVPQIAELQERAKRLRMDEELQPLKQQALQGQITAQAIQNETATLDLKTKKKEAEWLNKPIDIAKIPSGAYKDIMIKTAQDYGILNDGETPTNYHLMKFKEMVKENPEVLNANAGEYIQNSNKVFLPLKQKVEDIQGQITNQQTILDTTTNPTVMKEAQKQLEGLNEMLQPLQEQYNKLGNDRSQALNFAAKTDIDIKTREFIQNNQRILNKLPHDVRIAVTTQLELGQVQGAAKTLEEWTQKRGKEFAPSVETDYIPIGKDKYQQVVIDRTNGSTKPVLTPDGKPVIKTTEDLKKEKGAKMESVSDPFGKGFLEKSGKLSGEYEGEIVKTASQARIKIQTLDTMNQLLDRFESGKLAGWEKNIQQYAQAFGIPIDTTNLSAKEAFNALGEQLALQSRNQGEGMVLAGQMSDRDVQFLRDMNPQLIISKRGNRTIIKIRKVIEKRNQEVANLARQYKKEHRGMLDALDFEGYVKEKMGNTSVFGIPENSQLIGTDKITGLPVYKTQDGKNIIPNF